MRRLLLFLCLLPVFATAQIPLFETYFGSAMPEYARSVKQMPDSFVYMAGYVNELSLAHTNVVLYKLDARGNVRWQKTYGDTLDDNGLCLEKTRDGNFLLCGEKQTPSNLNDGILYKIDTSGNVLWYKTYGGPQYESFNRVAELPDGKLVLVGTQTDAGGWNGIYVMVTDSAGNMIWTGNYGGSDNDIGHSLCVLPDSGFVVFGDTRRAGGDYNVEGIRFTKNGTVLWDSTYTYNDTVADGCQGATLLSDGNILIFGESVAYAGSWFDFLVQKIDVNGNTIWWKKVGGPNPDAAFSMIEVPGGFLGTGYSMSYSSGPNNIIVFKTDTAGNLLWANPYGGPNIDIGYEMIPALGGGYYVGATANVSGDDQFGLLHVDEGGWAGMQEEDADGNVRLYPNPNNGNFTVLLPSNNCSSVVEIVSAGGALVFSEEITAGTTQLSLQEKLSPGMYFLRVISGKNVTVKKLVVD